MSAIWRMIGRIGGYALWIPVWVVIRFTTRTRVLVLCDDEVLVIKGWLDTGRHWSFPGGGKHRQESPDQAAVREVCEETGIVVEKTRLVPLGMMRQTAGHNHKFFGFALVLPKKPSLHLQKAEVAEAMWVKLDSLQKLSTEQHVQLVLEAWQKQR